MLKLATLSIRKQKKDTEVGHGVSILMMMMLSMTSNIMLNNFFFQNTAAKKVKGLLGTLFQFSQSQMSTWLCFMALKNLGKHSKTRSKISCMYFKKHSHSNSYLYLDKRETGGTFDKGHKQGWAQYLGWKRWIYWTIKKCPSHQHCCATRTIQSGWCCAGRWHLVSAWRKTWMRNPQTNKMFPNKACTSFAPSLCGQEIL